MPSEEPQNSKTYVQNPKVSEMALHKIVIVRTGEHRANTKDQFCGWLDSPLSDKGQQEAMCAGRYLKKAGIHFDMVHSSLLCRATETLNIILDYIRQHRLIIHKTWKMNERHFGNLTGMKRFDAVTKYGKDQVLKWQYSFEEIPPLMDENHKHYIDITEDIRYIDGPPVEEMPKGESLKMTLERVQAYWNAVIIPQLKNKKTLLLICHGDVLRSIVKFLNGISDKEIEEVNFLAGVPMVFDLNSDFIPAAPMYFLAEGSLDKAMVSINAKRRIIMK